MGWVRASGTSRRSKLWKWRWKHKQRIRLRENTNYHLTEFHFFDSHEEEIKL